MPKRRLRNLHNIKNCVKMSIEVGRITFSDDDEELDRLLQNVKLMVPDSGDDDDGGNEDSNVHDSQVSLFATVRSPTDISRSETGLAPGEGSNGERRNGGGPCQRPAPGPNTVEKLRANLPRAERKALRNLIRNPDLIISKADKGDSTVVMSTEQYLELACKHLYDGNTYQLLKSDPTQDIVRQFNSYIEECLEKGVIDRVQHERLLLPEGIDTQTIYFLPKIHKRPVKLRPIVSCTNGPTYTASAFLDKLLQPHMRKVKSFLKNSTELIHILRTLKVPPQAYLITLDVESLYTNISHEEAIKSLLKRFECDPQKVLVLDLLKYVLKNNVFKFGDQVFAQLHGVAMGTKLAPALATIYIGDLEEQFLENRPLKPELWVRYIDDVFLVWAHPLSEFETFLEDLNKTRERIRFTAEVSLNSCNFLDLTIYKSPKFLSTGLLSTKIYYKTTNTFSYPLGDSYMPTQIHRSIAIGEMTRLLRNTEDPTIFRHYKNKLIKHFANRKYPRRILRELRNFTHDRRLVILDRRRKRTRVERPLPFITRYTKYNTSLSRIFRRRWQNLFEDPRFYSLLPNPPFAAYRNRKKIRSLLSAKRREFGPRQFQTSVQLGSQKEFVYMKFNSHYCRKKFTALRNVLD